jgi:UMF1 family MFS transporter
MSDTNRPQSIWRKEVNAWCCYDWANSGYTTLMITVFAVYMQRVVFDVETSGSTGAVVWAWVVAVSMLLGAVLSPFAGALADARAGKRLGLTITALGGGFACMLMAVLPPQYMWASIAALLLANLCHELSLTFYNGFLPEISSETEMNRVSAVGMAWGYFGGGIALVLAMLILNFGDSFGLGQGTPLLRICIFSTGVWWAIFSLPPIFLLRDRQRKLTRASTIETGKNAFRDVLKTLRQLKLQRTLAIFLIAFLFFNDGVQTVNSQASTFAIQELKFSDSELVAVILMVQFVATPGAIIVGWIADKLGRKSTLQWCLLVWIGLLVSAWFIQSKIGFWFMAVGVAFVLGGTQAISRAIMGVLTPKHREARYFGFFNLSGKATSFMGTFFFGLIVMLTGSARLAIVNLLVFFVIGLILVTRINVKRGIKERQEMENSLPNPSDESTNDSE